MNDFEPSRYKVLCSEMNRLIEKFKYGLLDESTKKTIILLRILKPNSVIRRGSGERVSSEGLQRLVGEIAGHQDEGREGRRGKNRKVMPGFFEEE